MQIANIMLALGGDKGTQVPKYAVTVSEIAVLRAIHGNDAVTDIEPVGEIERSNREEISLLTQRYGRAKMEGPDGNQVGVVSSLFPGAAARAFRSLDELEIPEEFYKALERVKPRDPLDHDGDGKKGGSLSADKREELGLDGMTKGQLIDYAETNGIEVKSSDTKAAILTTIKEAEGAPAPEEAPAEETDENLFG